MTNDEKLMQWLRPGAIVPVDMDTTRILIEALRARLAQPECVCGEPNTAGVHRKDGPCYAQPEPAPTNNGRYLTGYKTQPEPELVTGDGYRWEEGRIPPSVTYTAPPQREWMNECADFWQQYICVNEIAQERLDSKAKEWIAKLREKNNG